MSGVFLLSNNTCDNKIHKKFSEEIDLKTCNTNDIAEYLDYILPKIEQKFSIEILRIKKFSFSYEFNNKIWYFNVFKKPIDCEYYSYRIPQSLETVCVFYLFNYYSFEQLGLSIESFLKEIILTNSLKQISGCKGYYDVKYSKHKFIDKKDKYILKENEHLQYYHFKETLADRKTILEFNNCMQNIVKELSTFEGILVEKAIQSDDSESFYISLKYRKKKIKRNLKISVRNHPMHTKAQMCFYKNNYENLKELEKKVIKTIKEFNWYNYKFSLDTYFDVLPEKTLVKKYGDDICQYSSEQIEFIEKNKELNKSTKSLFNSFDFLSEFKTI